MMQLTKKNTRQKFIKKKTRVCTRTRGRSETSLNTVACENVNVYMN